MENPRTAGPHFLLRDYPKSMRERIAESGSVRIAPSTRPVWLRTAEFGARLRWQSQIGAPRVAPLPSRATGPQLLASAFDPVARYRQAEGAGRWPLDDATPLDLGPPWTETGIPARRIGLQALSALLHGVLLLLLMIPAARRLELTEPADWNSMRFTLVAPSLEDLPSLSGEAEAPGDQDEGFRGLPSPPPAPEPEPSSEPETDPLTDAGPSEPEVQQPVLTKQAETEDEPPALEEASEPAEQEPPPPAQSPAPGEFQEGPELAQNRDPRLLPMPKAPSRRRAVLQLETPKASMPSRQGNAQLGTLELASTPGRAVQGAIQQMMRGGSVRQAVGDGVGGYSGAGIPSSGPSGSGSAVELLSDPRGVDFRPYLTQILAAVRRNWFAVLPESARLGMSKGRTLIQFSVSRSGSVPKLVIARSSGSPALDRAAVAGISASNPFPPLPSEYLGGDIRLQFTFLYNIRNR